MNRLGKIPPWTMCNSQQNSIKNCLQSLSDLSCGQFEFWKVVFFAIHSVAAIKFIRTIKVFVSPTGSIRRCRFDHYPLDDVQFGMIFMRKNITIVN